MDNETEIEVIRSAIDILCNVCAAPPEMVIRELTGWLWTEEEAGDIRGRAMQEDDQ